MIGGITSNGRYGIAKEIDELQSRELPSSRLLDPAATPKALREFAFGIGVPMPTRTCTRETAIALRGLVMPMFGNACYYSPDSLEVGEARNEIVRCALRDGVEWLFFLDYDVAPPPNAIIRLLNLQTDIAAGIYHAKQVPTYPLLMVKGHPYAFEDYELGDLIKVDGVGMGCTLIKMDVFKKIEPPWFKTVNPCTNDGSTILPQLTEDIYFCDKAKAAGFEIIVDSTVQCGHVDWKHGITYHLVEAGRETRRPLPGWTYRARGGGGNYVTQVLAPADHPGRKYADISPVQALPENPPLDLGSGNNPQPGCLGVDPYADPMIPNVVLKDMRDLSWYRREHGLTPSIFSCHALEHLPFRDVPATLRDWYNTLAPGGWIELIVPDGEMYMRSFVQRLDEGTDDSFEMSFINNGLFGDETADGQVHQSIFTERSIRTLLETSGFVDVLVEHETAPRIEGVVPETGQLRVKARKSGGE